MDTGFSFYYSHVLLLFLRLVLRGRELLGTAEAFSMPSILNGSGQIVGITCWDLLSICHDMGLHELLFTACDHGAYVTYSCGQLFYTYVRRVKLVFPVGEPFLFLEYD